MEGGAWKARARGHVEVTRGHGEVTKRSAEVTKRSQPNASEGGEAKFPETQTVKKWVLLRVYLQQNRQMRAPSALKSQSESAQLSCMRHRIRPYIAIDLSVSL